jgi:two-component system CheB/CheR fusion protein
MNSTTQPPNSPRNDTPGLSHYVGIGASAGGLEAIETFFKHTPADSNLAYIVIQHLSPDHKSLMVELLSKHTEMPVHRAEEGLQVEANHIYLIPPKINLTIFHGKLLLKDQDAQRGINLPIDIFLRSLAEDQGKRAIAVILSGTGSDGTRGIRAIKEAGGMVMAQDEESAKFDGMPKSAINTGLPDFILPPQEMPSQLLAFVKHPYANKPESSDILLSDEDGLTRIFAMLREQSKVDFTFYKPSTVVRRIERRMAVNQIHDLQDYVRLLERFPGEVITLYQDLLIGVTSFLRDREAFDQLQDKWLLELLNREGSREIRFWVAGCSTGEEAYSLAILAHECMLRAGRMVDLKIFATDVDREAILKAGAGIYSENIAADLNPALLSKYFYRRDHSFQVARHIREMVVFAQHNIIKDPPFTNIDLVSCRNLLIYLQPILQRKVLELFSFSLNDKGLLFLGSSETTGELSDLFEPLHHKWKLYRSRGKRLGRRVGSEPITSFDPGRMHRVHIGHKHPTRHVYEEERVLDRLVQAIHADYAPITLVVNEQMELLHVVGDTEGLLKLPAGRMLNDITKMANQALSIPLATGIQKVFRQRNEVTYANVHIALQGHNSSFNLRIKLLPEKKGQDSLAVVYLEEQKKQSTPLQGTQIHAYDLDQEAQQRIQDLEQELQFTRENLQATVEELETSNEELQATNEELLASNEELQSTNEELQSVNEELYTVNAEYQSKIVELSELNNDLDNLLISTELGTIFLDEDLVIRKFTPKSKAVFRLIDSDEGRLFNHAAHRFESLQPIDLVLAARDSGKAVEQEARIKGGRWYLIRVTPYHISPEVISGYVVTLVDINPIKSTQQALLLSEERNALAMKAAGLGSWDWNLRSGQLDWSETIESMFGFRPGEFSGTHDAFLDCLHPEDRQRVFEATNRSIQQHAAYDIQHRIVRPDGSVRWLADTGTVLHDADGTPVRMVGMIRDITTHKEREAEILHKNDQLETAYRDIQTVHRDLSQSEALLRSILRAAPSGISLLRTGRFEWVNQSVLRMTGYTQEEITGQPASELFPNCSEQNILADITRQIEQDGVATFETRMRGKDGRQFEVLLSAAPLSAADSTDNLICAALDISDFKQAQSALHDKELRIKSLLERINEGLICITQDGFIKTINPAAEAIFNYPPGQLTGAAIDRLLPEADFPIVSEDSIGQTRTDETNGRRMNGQGLPLQLRITPMKLENRFYYSLIINPL